MDAFVESFFTFLKSIVESPEFRALVIGLIMLGVGAVGARRVRQSIKSDAEKSAATQQQALEAKYADDVRRIELAQRDLLNKALENYQRLFTLKTQEFEAKSKAYDDLKSKSDSQDGQINALNKRVGELETGLGQYKLTVAEKDSVIKELTDNQVDMAKRLEALEQERDGLQELAKQREDELQKRDQTIARQEQEINTLNGKVDELQKRLDAIEKKADTGELDPAKVPDATAHSPDAAPPEAEPPVDPTVPH